MPGGQTGHSDCCGIEALAADEQRPGFRRRCRNQGRPEAPMPRPRVGDAIRRGPCRRDVRDVCSPSSPPPCEALLQVRPARHGKRRHGHSQEGPGLLAMGQPGSRGMHGALRRNGGGGPETMIAALYVAPGGVYYGLDDVDPWPESRDARTYVGPWPVVAHPPCARWGRYWFGGPSCRERKVKGDDGGCFAAALEAVRAYGGVLEHPEVSAAFATFGLRRPDRG